MSADVHGLVGAYAVDAVDEQERVAFEAHLAECAECRAEVAGLREAAVQLAATVDTAPPSSMRDAVLAAARTVRPLPPVVPAITPSPAPGTLDTPAEVVPLAPRRRTRRWLAAATVAAAIAIGTVAWSPWSDETTRPPSVVQQVLAASDAQRFEKTLDGARATIVRSNSLGKAVIVADNMPAAPAGKDYQVWLDMPGKGMVSAGVMPHGSAPTLTMALTGDAALATGAGITVEPAGGSREPSGAPIALFSFG